MRKRERQRILAESLIEEMEPVLAGMLLAWTQDHALIEDILMDTWVAMTEHIEMLERHENPQGWLVKTAKYKAWHALEKQKWMREKEAALCEAIRDNIPKAIQEETAFFENLSRWLPEKDVEILKFYYLYGVSYREIADHFGISEPACRQKVSRATRKLRKHREDLKQGLP